MNPKVQEQIDLIKNIIVATLPVEQIYLFGSYAYGKPHQDSDLDFYVVLDDKVELRNIDAAIKIRKAIDRKKEMPADILTSKQSVFRQRQAAPTLERQVAREGILLYG
ncbi:DNA polymerase beta domain-containing protein [Candidatus Termititenax persephonae]|uniref:DNA polymerase beta domain-containing protein n=1 Tax=Candidatus Termititenax persephonae TaxID=2218525 RepID=A0A388TET5_9BACT|nr:DNA polymerase beta domain-containing protein [Candidatus Termititenax persephonae]